VLDPRLTGAEDVPVNPFRSSLYSAEELLGQFRADRTGTYADTLDFETYRNFVVNGRRSRAPYLHSIVHAIHDNSITQAIRQFTEGRRMVGIMGGHRLSRSSNAYAGIVTLAKRLSEEGLTLTSGGGPGAMEATHVGAGLAGATDVEVGETLAELRAAPELPTDLGALVAADGTVDQRILADLHQWQEPAFAVARARVPSAASLAVPTWHYGHEPPTPIASHIGKYFENSIREDGLLALAKWGVIFAEGRAGTIQEIFQDAAQNYYRSYDWFSPMVLFGTDYWRNRFPVEPVLRALFDTADERLLTVTDDPDEAVAAITRFEPPDRAEFADS
jgi:predicted Rossmann-fold nucleotide-binding protein